MEVYILVFINIVISIYLVHARGCKPVIFHHFENSRNPTLPSLYNVTVTSVKSCERVCHQYVDCFAFHVSMTTEASVWRCEILEGAIQTGHLGRLEYVENTTYYCK